MKIQLPSPPDGPGPFDLGDLRRYGTLAVEFDRALHKNHDQTLRQLARDVVEAFQNAEHYTVPSAWIARIEKLRDHLRRSPS